MQGFLTYCRSIQQAGGVPQLRLTLSALRDTAQNDRQISPTVRARLLATYDAVEAKLLPATN